MKKKERKREGTVVPYADRRIRLGYLSSDLGGGRLRDLLPVFFFSYDRSRFDVYAYHTGIGGDTTPFAQGVTLREIGDTTPEEAAEIIRRDEIDLLVDLSLRTPDDRIHAIMQRRPAPHIVSLAADCPQDLAMSLPAVEGHATFGHCYTPFHRVQCYTCRAPLCDDDIPTIGIAGELGEGRQASLITLLAGVLHHLPAIRLILPACIGAALSEEDAARLAAAGSEAAVLELVDELPYDRLDLVCGVDVDLLDVCHAADHSVPLITAVDFVHGQHALCLMQQLGLPLTASESELPAEICRLLSCLPQLSEFHENLHWRLFDAFDAGAVLFSVERAYSRILVRGQQDRRGELAAALSDAAAHEHWGRVISAAHALDSMECLLPEERMSLAWAYFFTDQVTLAGRWALAAEGVGRDREAARIYLSVISKTPPGTGREIYERAYDGLQRIEEGLPAVSEVRSVLLKTCINYVGLVHGPEMAEVYARQYAAEATDIALSRFYYGASLFQLNALDVPPSEVYQKSLHYGSLFSDVSQYSHANRQRRKKIRIGYISGDFREHVMQYFIWPFLAGFDQNSFEVYVYSLGASDQFSEFFRSLVTQWRDLSDDARNMELVAGAIHADEIDILFDLSGHTAGSGLAALAWKPAPVQLSGLGYMATTGLPTVDYFVTDHYCDPEGSGSESVYVEKLLRLTSQFCYNGHTNLPAAMETPARTKGYIQFASFNQYRKLRDPMLAAWREIMERVPESRLLLKNGAYGQRGVVAAAHERMKNLGFDMSRVMFEPATKDYMLRYLDVDIALDTFPWPGGGTTCDALYMGVPVVSYYTARHSTRFTYSLLANIGLADLASERIEDYIETAAALAGDLNLLDALHREMRDRMKASPVMDQERYIREMEECYRAIWAAWQAEQTSG